MLRFLVVGDHLATTSALRELLESDGHRVQACHSGRGAIEALSRGEFDVVLTDWELPYVSGETVTKTIRECQPHACLIVSSGRAHLPLAGAACHVFGQPLDYENFERTVVACRAHRGPNRNGHCYLIESPAPQT